MNNKYQKGEIYMNGTKEYTPPNTIDVFNSLNLQTASLDDVVSTLESITNLKNNITLFKKIVSKESKRK